VRKRNIIIELTALLDVILIMIFILLVQAKSNTAQAMEIAEAESRSAASAQKKWEDADAQIRSLKEELKLKDEEAEDMKRQLVIRSAVLDNSFVIGISVLSDASIQLEENEGKGPLIPYRWEEDSYAYNSLRALMLGYLDKTEEKSLFIVFQYDRTKIYRTEYDMLQRILQETKLEAKKRELPLNIIEIDSKEE